MTRRLRFALAQTLMKLSYILRDWSYRLGPGKLAIWQNNMLCCEESGEPVVEVIGFKGLPTYGIKRYIRREGELMYVENLETYPQAVKMALHRAQQLGYRVQSLPEPMLKAYGMQK